MGHELRQASAEVCGSKDVSENVFEIGPRDLIRVNAHRPVAKIQRPNVVQPKYMIHMAMSDQNSVEMCDLRSQGLLAKVDRGIDKDLPIPMLDQYRNP